MKILIISTNDFGGAGKASVRLHTGLLNSGIDSKILFLNKRFNYPEAYVFQKPYNNSLLKKINRKVFKTLRDLKLLKSSKKIKEEKFIENREKGLELFSYPNSKYDITQSELYKQADLINLHWVSGFLDYQSFFKKNKKTVVWTLHDMNPFSGGEHYQEEFLGMDNKGFPIKRTLSIEEKQLFENVLKLKKNTLGRVQNLYFVTLCNWMTNTITNSDFFNKFPIHHIPNGIDSKIFTIRDKVYSRNLLNISLDKKVVLFVADLINANRKGFNFLVNAIEKLESDNVQLLVIGKKNEKLEGLNNIIQYGTVNDNKLLSSVYSAADVFVIPSLMDNLPNTVLESLLCGTPVIGFPIGGIPDMIYNNKNGIIANEVSVEALVNAITRFLNNRVLDSNEEIRSDAIKKYDLEVQSKNYIKLFKSLIN